MGQTVLWFRILFVTLEHTQFFVLRALRVISREMYRSRSVRVAALVGVVHIAVLTDLLHVVNVQRAIILVLLQLDVVHVVPDFIRVPWPRIVQFVVVEHILWEILPLVRYVMPIIFHYRDRRRAVYARTGILAITDPMNVWRVLSRPVMHFFNPTRVPKPPVGIHAFQGLLLRDA